MPRPKTYRIGRSRTGLGLFATAPIAKGDLILEYTGSRIPTPDAHARERKTGCKFMFELNDRWTIDGSSRRNVARYVNHACRPNAEFELVRGRLMLRACKKLAPGDEITCDYGRDYFDLFIAPIGCRCAACAPRS
jgi:SET domain-containing protein